MKISVVTPIYNESKNIPILFKEIEGVLSEMNVEYEIVAVDDGSKDESFNVLKEIASTDPRIKVVRFVVNTGQTAALAAGIDHASGDLIISMDSDLENDPRDIPHLVAKLNEGYDVVSGWRTNRWTGQYLTRKFPSVIANQLISKIVGVKLHDYGCILKIYKREVIESVQLYGEMHRFIPAYASWMGARVAEIPVAQRKRIHGRSNYGFSRIFRVLLDLIVIKFLHVYMNKPMHFFGGLGFSTLALGIFFGLLSIVLKILMIRDFVATPLPVFSALFVIVGVQLLAMGVIAEIMMRTYYESQGKKAYRIKETCNIN